MRLNLTFNCFKNIGLTVLLSLFIFSTATAADINARIFKFQQKVAKIGSPKAQYKLAYMYEAGRGTEKDLNKAALWYKKAAKQKYKAAKHRLEFINVKTKGFKAKHKAWLKSLISDANNGDDNVQFLLASMYEDGIGVKRNLKQAQRYYKLSTAKGNADAESELFRIVQKINMESDIAQKQQAAIKAEAKKQQAKKDAEAREQKAKQLAAERERKRLEKKRKKLAAEKRKQAVKQKMLAKKQDEDKKAKQTSKQKDKNTTVISKAENKEETFESDLCTGAAARFRTQCN